MRPVAVLALLLTWVFGSACGDQESGNQIAVPGQPSARKTVAEVRATRRLFDGAPPIIPHQSFAASCSSCHQEGRAVEGVGYAPPSPHVPGDHGGSMERCVQCHVFQQTEEEFRGSRFEGLAQDLRQGERLHEFAPPVIPHPVLLRENCAACHTGPAAREEIRCPHPERTRCQQCHVENVAGPELYRR